MRTHRIARWGVALALLIGLAPLVWPGTLPASAANSAAAIAGQAVAAPPAYAFQFNAGISRPVGVAVAANGTVYVADANNKQVEEFSAAGAYVTAFGGYGSGNGQFDHPYGIAVAPGTVAPGGAIYVSDLYNGRVEAFTPPSTVVRYVAPNGSDSGDCTANPCRTVRYGVAQAADGNTVQVAAGTYTETVTISTSLTLAGAGAGRTVLSGSGSLQAPLVTITGTAGQVTLSGLTLQGNFAPNGGALLNAGQPGQETTRLVDSVVTGNQATSFGGGIDNAGGDLQAISSTISGNAGLNAGGGIANSSPNTVTIIASTVANNVARASGGGIYNPPGGTVRLLDSTVYGNTASQSGGGISDQGGALTVTASTVYSNTTRGVGGGIFVLNSAPVTLTTTILAGNHARTGGPDCSGVTLASGGYNLLGTDGYSGTTGLASCGLADGQNGDQVGTPGSPLDPRLAPLQDNGGPTPTSALLPDSPAIYVVPPSRCAGPADQRGFPRPDPVAGNGHCSVGAVEYEARPATRLVTPGGTDSGACTVTPCQTIGYGVTQAAPVGDIISVGPGTYTETVTISKSLTLAGAGAGQTVIAGPAGNVPSLVTITGTAVSQVTLSGLTLQGNVTANNGGGLLNAGRPGLETTRLVNSVITNNSGIQGGGIDNVGGDLEVMSSTIGGNASVFGGGLANGISGTVTLVASTIAANSAGTGGGIYNLAGAPVRLVDSTVYGNTASQSGGGIYTTGPLALSASTVYSNTTRGVGGGLFVLNSAPVTLTATILAGNHARASGSDCSGPLRSGGYNLLGTDGYSGTTALISCGLTDGQNGDQVGMSSSPLDPRLGPLQDNGGPALTLAPLAGSPAIDLVPAATCAGPTDQRGFPRPDGPGLPCDVGAVESSGVAGLATATSTVPTAAGTPVSSTATATSTPVSPTGTMAPTTATSTAPPTATNTAPPTLTATPTATNTAMPTAASTATPMTATNTATPTVTGTNTSTPVPPTSTGTSIAATRTSMPAPTATTTLTVTTTPVPPTGTSTIVPPTGTSTPAPASTTPVLPTKTTVPRASASTTTVAPPISTATVTPSLIPTAPCRPFYATVAPTGVSRGGTDDILFVAPLGSTIAVTVATGAAYPRRALLLLPTELGGVQARILTGMHVVTGYRYTFAVGAFFGYGYALLSFPVPRDAPLGAVIVPAAAREPGGCTATITTRFTVVAAQVARRRLARSTVARASPDATGVLLAMAGRTGSRAALVQAGVTPHNTAPAGEQQARGMAVGAGAVVSTRGATPAACRDTVVSALPMRVTAAALVRVSAALGYLSTGSGACRIALYVALRGATRRAVLATAWVAARSNLGRFTLVGGGGVLRGSGRGARRDYVAAPGRYLLQLHVAPRGRGARGRWAMRVVTLAYTQERAALTTHASRLLPG